MDPVVLRDRGAVVEGDREREAEVVRKLHRGQPDQGALVRSGLLEATAGPSGGYRLARPPNEVSLFDVIRAIEGALERERCVLMGGPCDWEAVCPLHLVWHEIEEGVVTRLQRTTFDELAFVDQAIEGGPLPIPPDTHRSAPKCTLTPWRHSWGLTACASGS